MKPVVVITEDVQNVHLLLEYRPHIDVSLTCETIPNSRSIAYVLRTFDSEGIPNQAPEMNKPMILNGPTSRNREGSDQMVIMLPMIMTKILTMIMMTKMIKMINMLMLIMMMENMLLLIIMNTILMMIMIMLMRVLMVITMQMLLLIMILIKILMILLMVMTMMVMIMDNDEGYDTDKDSHDTFDGTDEDGDDYGLKVHSVFYQTEYRIFPGGKKAVGVWCRLHYLILVPRTRKNVLSPCFKKTSCDDYQSPMNGTGDVRQVNHPSWALQIRSHHRLMSSNPESRTPCSYNLNQRRKPVYIVIVPRRGVVV
ncbi:hypothetical protein ANN_23260 [Periplaneta americana]|uniref:Uncharacterized protein n=1 Tax=Periplaneta americana TaxID=6978 RepID=A0ABQ8SM24_PERAM|nr:hypothetical protein ANN_23260 [Periplaneta americana]